MKEIQLWLTQPRVFSYLLQPAAVLNGQPGFWEQEWIREIGRVVHGYFPEFKWWRKSPGRFHPSERDLFLSEVIQLHAWASCIGFWRDSDEKNCTISTNNAEASIKIFLNYVMAWKILLKSSLIHEWANFVWHSHNSRAFKSPVSSLYSC